MDKQQKRMYDNERYLRQKEEFLERDRQRRLLDPRKGIERAMHWTKKHPRGASIISARCQAKRKRDVLSHYSKGELKCAICGEIRIDCLSLDHINNDGQEHRKSIGRVNFYRFIRQQGYPKGYQVLCMNCQWVKKAEHQRGKRRLLSK